MDATPAFTINPPSRPAWAAGPTLWLLDAASVALLWPATLLALPGLRGIALPGLLAPACYLLLLYALGRYRRDALLDLRRSLARAPLAALLGSAPAGVVAALLPPWLGGGGGAALFGAGVAAFSLAGFVARIGFAGLGRGRLFHRRLLVIGAGRRAWDLAWLLRHEGRAPAYDIGFVHDPTQGAIDPRLAADASSLILPAVADIRALAESFAADQIVVAPDERRGMAVEPLLGCRIAGFPVTDYMRCLEHEIGRVDLKRLDLSFLLYEDGFVLSPADRALKRLLDIAASAALLLVASPLLLAAAVAVKLTDRGPVLYRQQRVTRGGRVFRILKLRTMRVDAERAGAVWAAERDPRITRIGAFLRRTRLDELPQLVNVLRGDMSFVGPRPERPEFTRDLAAKLPLYDARHAVKAGLTGWAQVNYPYGASLDDARSKLSYDLYYVKNFSVVFDLRIIMQTIRVVFWPGGVR